MKHKNDKSLSQLKPSQQFTDRLVTLSEFEIYQPNWIDLTKVEIKSQPWLWQNVIPLETSMLLAGAGGIGKSTLLLFIIAKVTSGELFNCCGDDVILQKGHVILLAAEDREDTHLVPNLLAAGADLSKIHCIKSKIGCVSGKNKFLELDKDLDVIEQKLIELQKQGNHVKLMVIDPITYFTGETKDHIQTEVANFIQSLTDLAKSYGMALILNKHLRKKSGKQSVSSVVDEVGGSAAWVNTPRQAFVVMRHPENENKILMFNLKTNLTKRKTEAYCYTIEQTEIQASNGIFQATKLVWSDKKETIGIEEASNKELFNKSKGDHAQDIIHYQLNNNGATSIENLKEICEKQGISERTCQRAYLSMEKENTIRRQKGTIKPHFELSDGWHGDNK